LRTWLSWPKRIIAWLAQARLAAFAAVVVVAATYLSIVVGTEKALRLSGLALQLLGIAAAALGIRDTRRMFGKPSFFQLLRNWAASMPGLKGKTRTVAISGSAMISSSASATVWRGSGPEATLEQRLDALEFNLKEVESRVRTSENAISTNHREISSKLREEVDERREQDRQLHLRIESASTDGLHLAAAGAFWLAAGVTLSTAPNEILGLLG
jgi:hypothetical protein